MKHIKKFEALVPKELNPPNRILISKYNDMVNFVRDHGDWIRYNTGQKILSIGLDKSNYEGDYIKIGSSGKSTQNFWDTYEHIEKCVEEGEFMEDCLIELTDKNLKVTINVLNKIFTVLVNTIDDNALLIDVIKSNKLRFESSISNIHNIGGGYDFNISYKLLREI